MNALSTAVIALAAVALYVGVHHLLFFLRARDRKELVPFSLTCFAVALYDIGGAHVYSSTDVTQSIPWDRLEFAAIAAASLSLLWFVHVVTGGRHRRFVFTMTAFWLGLLTTLFLLPAEAVWTGETVLRSFTLWGHAFAFPESRTTLLASLRDLLGLINVSYAMVSFVLFAWRNNRRDGIPLVIGMVLLILAVFNDVAVSNGVYSSLYLIEWGFMGLILAMAYSVGTTHVNLRTARDVAEAQSRRLARAVAEAGEGIMLTDATARVLYVNPAFEQITGYRAEECVGKPASILKSGRHDAEFYRALWAELRAGRSWHGVFINRRKDGSTFEEEATLSPIHGDAGDVAGYVAVKRDITRERLLDQQMRRSQNMSAMGQLAHRVAHDFNNALTGILANAQLIEDVTEDRDIRSFAKAIRSVGLSIAELNGNLMAFAHPGKLQMRRTRLNKVFSTSDDVLSCSVDPRHELVCEISDEPVAVMADCARLEHGLVQLVLNASEAMPEPGRVLVVVRRIAPDDRTFLERVSGIPEHDPAGERFAVVMVSDTGPGISESATGRVFDPFFSTKEKAHHPGLGLSKVFQIATEHHGFTSVEVRPGAGATFRLFIPLADDAPAAEHASVNQGIS